MKLVNQILQNRISLLKDNSASERVYTIIFQKFQKSQQIFRIHLMQDGGSVNHEGNLQSEHEGVSPQS